MTKAITTLTVRYCVLFCLVFSVCSSMAQYSEREELFNINGTVASSQNKTLLLSYSLSSGRVIDTAEVKDGKFKFKGKIPSPVFANLYFKHEPSHYLDFYLEKGQINIQLDIDSIERSQVTGSVSNIDYDSVKAILSPYYETLKALKVAYNFANKYGLDSAKRNVNTIFDQLRHVQRKILTEYALNHPNSYAITERLLINFTNDQTEVPLLKMVYDNFSPQVKKSEGGKSLLFLIQRIDAVKIGAEAPDFKLPNEKGKEIEFSSIKGKYILLDFWASWCVPCRAENPSLVDAYKRYSSRNFTIVGVSLDTNKDSWLKAIEDDHLTWINLSDLRGYQTNSINKLYSVQAIPDNFLISPNGQIIARGLRGRVLEQKLKILLEKE